MAGLPRRVVLRKPKIKKPLGLRPDPVIQPINKPVNPVPEPVITNPEPIEDELDIPDVQDKKPEPKQEIIQTKSKKTIIVKHEPVVKELVADERKKDIERLQSFDDKFIDRLHIKSQITKDKKTLEKLEKPKLQRKKAKSKLKIKFSLLIIMSLVLSLVLIVFSQKIFTDYINGKLDGSLASFIYVVSMILLTFIVVIWFISELFTRD